MDDTTQTIVSQAVTSLVRHGLTALAGILTSWGLLATNQSTNFVEIGAGAALFIVGYLWSLYQKRVASSHVERLQAKVETLKDKIPVSQGGNK